MANQNGDGAFAGHVPNLSRRTVLRGIAGSALLSGMGQAAAEHADESRYTKRDLTIESWDGTELACSVFEPTSAGPHPSMLMTHGWAGDRSSATSPGMFATHGYVVLTYDSRGFGESGGEANTNGPAEVNDAKRLITWLGNADGQTDDQGFDRPNVQDHGKPSPHGPNPRVGMIGGSYAGGIQLNTAARDDRLDAIVPIIPWYDLSFSLEPNDVVKRNWGALLWAVGVTGSRGLTSGDGQPSEEDLRYGLDYHLHSAHVLETGLNGFRETTETWYKQRSPVSKMDEIAANDTPCLTIIGWPDTLFVPNEGIWIHQGLAARDVDSRLVFYNSGHTLSGGANQGEAALQRGLSFIDEHLVGSSERIGPTKAEPVEYFEVQHSEALEPDTWTTVKTMPPRDAEQDERSLADAETTQSGQTLLFNSVAPTSASQLSPQNHDTQGTSANFDFPVESAYEVVGTPTLEAQVQPLGNASHLFWGFYLVRDGEATLVDNQVMPFRVERARDAPSEPVTVEGELVAFQRTFEAGDVLRLTVSTTDAGFNSARQSSGVIIDHANSSVTLPVVRE